MSRPLAKRRVEPFKVDVHYTTRPQKPRCAPRSSPSSSARTSRVRIPLGKFPAPTSGARAQRRSNRTRRCRRALTTPRAWRTGTASVPSASRRAVGRRLACLPIAPPNAYFGPQLTLRPHMPVSIVGMGSCRGPILRFGVYGITDRG